MKSGIKSALRIALVLALSAGINCALAAQAAVNSEPVKSAPIKASWQVKEIYFPYFGLTTLYSCDGLRDKVRRILHELGGRDDMLVSVGGCIDLSGPVRNPSVRIIVANPSDAADTRVPDPKLAQQLAKNVRKGRSAASSEPFEAAVKRVSLFTKERSNISAAGDCELLEQMRDRVIKPLGGVIVHDDIRCTPYQGTVGNQRLEVDILVAVDTPKAQRN